MSHPGATSPEERQRPSSNPTSPALRTSDLDYELDQGRIATHAAEPRDAAKLLVVAGASPGSPPEHRIVRDLPGLLRPGDLLIINDTRVLPARFEGVRADTGGKMEGLYLRDAAAAETSESTSLHWVVMLKMKRPREGAKLLLHAREKPGVAVELQLIARATEPEAARTGAWIARVITSGEGVGELASTLRILERIGRTPLPPYILAARKSRDDAGDEHADRYSYQTVYASADAAQAHSLAAPTAGLHFTPPLLEALETAGVRMSRVTLHVGLGTFKPIETEFVHEHPMHQEWCRVPEETVSAIERTRAAGGRVIPVGTTSVRTLESFESLDDMRRRGAGGIETRLLITPGYRFKFADGLMTNFHLPRSTLMALVAAMLEHTGAAEPGRGVGRLRRMYAEAQRDGYRFYSLGDAMLLAPL